MPNPSTVAATKMTFHGFRHGEPAEPAKKRRKYFKVTRNYYFKKVEHCDLTTPDDIS